MVNKRKAGRYVYISILLVGLYFITTSPWSNKVALNLSCLQNVTEISYKTSQSELVSHGTDRSVQKPLANMGSIPFKPEDLSKPSIEVPSQEIDKNSKIDSSTKLSTNDRISHIRSLLPIFEKYRPIIEPLGKYKDDKKAPEKAHDQKIPVFTKEELANYLEVPEDAKRNLTKSHHDTVENLPHSYPKGIFEGQGVVYTSGGKYLPIMVTSLRMLRRVSPLIPVEVFLANKDEYEPEICDKLFPMLGAKCIILEDIYGEDFFKSFDIRTYQLKALAILASSFEDVIFIDADNVPIRNVEESLHREPYLSAGYITWPDYWYRTTSTHYYDIAGIVLGERVRGNLSITDPKEIPQADLENALPDKSSESGQLMISKSKHFRSLLLTVYYNLNGFTAYYKLFSQGSGGEGDKETFIAGALALNETIYQVKTDLRPSGRFDKGGFRGSGMLQSVPFDDYEKHVLKTRPSNISPRILFVHFNMFKLNLRLLFFEGEKEYFTSDEKRIRYCGKPSGNTELFDYQDFEFYMWREVLWTACDMPKLGINFKDWKDVSMEEMCKKATEHFEWLERTHNS